MRFDILTLFPAMFEGPFRESIIRRAVEAGRVAIQIHDIRAHAPGKHQVTDDTPYGGGGGMIMKPEPIFNAVEALLGDRSPSLWQDDGAPPVPVVLLSPQGRLFSHLVARELARQPRLVLICGRYEGVDERVRQHLCTDEISIGDYVLSGGELAAMVVVDAVTRLLPGVLGDPGAPFEDSHVDGLLEYPHYTRPAVYRGHAVPPVLLSGHHAEIVHWRRQESLRRTFQRRPDLLSQARLSEADRAFLRQMAQREPADT
ncbi:MAG: tRNA (guanosine(37)-N1)-methyltransferase TrmD [Chloroflexota bacterium]